MYYFEYRKPGAFSYTKDGAGFLDRRTMRHSMKSGYVTEKVKPLTWDDISITTFLVSFFKVSRLEPTISLWRCGSSSTTTLLPKKAQSFTHCMNLNQHWWSWSKTKTTYLEQQNHTINHVSQQMEHIKRCVQPLRSSTKFEGLDYDILVNKLVHLINESIDVREQLLATMRTKQQSLKKVHDQTVLDIKAILNASVVCKTPEFERAVEMSNMYTKKWW